jgi:transcriptional regulator with GAF, ATPase, and Fis domain
VADEERDAELAGVFAEVARALLAEPTLEGMLGRICKVAVDVVPGCEAAGTSIVRGLGRGQRIETLASAGEVPARVDALQYETGEGPCLDAIREHEVFETADLLTEGRWPRFARQAAEETGVRSMLAMRLYAEEDTYGALNLYSRRVDAFGDESRAIGGVLAAHGAIAFSGAREHGEIETLQRAMATRELIGQAMGILMNRRHVTSDQAFEMLVQASQHLNRKLRDVAEEVATTGTDPETLG